MISATALLPLLACTLFLDGTPLSARQAPPLFAFRFGSPGEEYGKAIATDRSSNVIVAGLFQNTVDFDPGAGVANLTNRAGVSMVMAKYNKLGKYLWAKSVGAAGVVMPQGVAADGNDNIYVAGYFGTDGAGSSTTDFDPGPGVANLTNSGGRDPFLAKYDREGNYLWAITIGSVFGSNTEEAAWDLAVDTAGNVYFAGSLHGTFDLDASPNGNRLYLSQGGSDAFVVKYDSSGRFVWGFGFGGPGDDEALAVALDAFGHLYVCGSFSFTADFDPGPGMNTLTGAGGTDIFIARYTTEGVFEKAIALGGWLSETIPPGAMRTDSRGNIYLSGRFRGTIDMNPGFGTHNLTNTADSDNLFVASYTPSLSLRWAFSIVSDGGPDGGHRVAVDIQESLWVVGWFSGTADFDGGPGVYRLTSNGTNNASDAFLARYDKDGNLLWAHGFGARISGAEHLTVAAGLALDGENNAYVTGKFYGQADFDPSPGRVVLTSAGLADGFVARYDAEGNLLSILNFPCFSGDNKRYTGIGVANWGDTSAEVQFTAYDNSGFPLSSPSGILNPRTITVPAGEQIALLAEQIHNFPFDTPRNGWIQAQSSSSQLTGFFLQGNEDMTLLDGAVAGNQTYTGLYFTRAQPAGAAKGFRNLINVVNPNPVPVRLDFSLLDENGRLRSTATRSLGPRGRLGEDIASLLPEIDLLDSKGYVKLRSTVGIIGYQAIDSGDAAFALPAQSPSAATRLASAQFASGVVGGIAYFTNVNIINTSAQSRTVQLALVRNDGSRVTSTNVIPLAPGQQILESGDALFGLPDPASSDLKEGSLAITADGVGLIGDVVFGDPVNQRFLASLPLEANPVSDLVFSHVAEGSTDGSKPYFTGIAIYNPNASEVTITLDVYSEKGANTGSASLTLAPGGRVSKTLPQLVPSMTNQIRGYIRIHSTGGPVVAFELFGDQSLEFLAALPPQPITP